MRYLFLILITVGFSIPVLSQRKSHSKKLRKEEEQNTGIFFCGAIEKDAEVDTRHWRDYLNQNLQLDSLAQDTIPEGTYSITATYIIGRNGCIDEVKILNDPGFGLGKKVAEVISKYEQWIPAERNGRRVKAYRRQTITFIVEDDECEEKMPVEFIL